jgi:hypothetical protein
MTTEDSAFTLDGMAGRPLCSTYDVLQFNALSVQVQSSGTACARTICWVVGVHRSGDAEVIGQWLAENLGAFDWRAVAADISKRGVMRIGCLVGSMAEQVESEFRSSNVIAVPIDIRHGGASAEATTRRLRRQRTRIDATARRFSQALHRAVRKHAAFPCDTAAVAFVSQELEQLERRICWAPPAGSIAGQRHCGRGRTGTIAAQRHAVTTRRT